MTAQISSVGRPGNGIISALTIQTHTLRGLLLESFSLDHGNGSFALRFVHSVFPAASETEH